MQGDGRVRPRLLRCERFRGVCDIRSGDPPIQTLSNVVYTPYDHGRRWGIFDEHRQPVTGCLDRREPHDLLIDQIPEIPGGIEDVPWAPDEEYIYGWRFNLHFGHFLVETLPRLWWLAQEPLNGRKILMHGDGDASGWFECGFARTIWSALGISPENLSPFDKPVRIRQLRVPLPSLQQQTYGHEAFGRLCRQIGASLLNGKTSKNNSTPVYLSKTKLDLGVHVIANENIVEARLAADGIEIIHPQFLSLDAQIELF